MKFESTSLGDVFLLKPRVFGDQRGFFLESWNALVAFGQTVIGNAGIQVMDVVIANATRKPS